jgi:hypothetical protein
MSRTTDELLAAREKNVPRGAFNMHPIFVKDARGAKKARIINSHLVLQSDESSIIIFLNARDGAC